MIIFYRLDFIGKAERRRELDLVLRLVRPVSAATLGAYEVRRGERRVMRYLMNIVENAVFVNGKLTDDYSDVIISASIALAVFIGALLSNSGQGRRGISGLAVGVIYAFVVVSVPLLAYPTEVDWLKIIRIIAIAAVSGAVGGSINLVKSNKSFHKNRKKRN